MDVLRLDVSLSQRSSRIGNQIDVPSIWEAEDKGDIWILSGADVTIEIHTSTIVGSPHLTEYFRATAENFSSAGKNIIGIDTLSPAIGKAGVSLKVSIVPIELDGRCTLIYGLATNEFMHIVIISTSVETLIASEVFFDEIVASFRAI